MLERSEATFNLVNTVKFLGKNLDQQVFNIDKNFSLPEKNQLKPNKKKYNSYKKKYLLEENNKDIYSKKIFFENLKSLLN